MPSIPRRISAGTTVRIPVTLTAYPADEWTLSLAMRGPGVIDIEASAEGTIHVIDATPAESGAWASGGYWYSVRVTDGADVVEVETGHLEVLADLADAEAGYDGRTHAERTLAAIEALIEGRATKDQQSYRIGDRELVRMSVGDLLKLRAQYRAAVTRARSTAAGRPFGRLVKLSLP